MFSKFIDMIKFLLIHIIRIVFAATSLAPLVLVIGISISEDKCSLIYFLCGLVIFILLVGICCCILKCFEKKPQKFQVIKEIERKDNDILTYLFIFLLPFIRSNNSMLGNQPITTAVCIFVLLVVIADIGAYHFNPVLRILGYHVYSVNINNAQGILLAKTKDVLYGEDIELELATLSSNYKIYMHTRSKNV